MVIGGVLVGSKVGMLVGKYSGKYTADVINDLVKNKVIDKVFKSQKQKFLEMEIKHFWLVPFIVQHKFKHGQMLH